jgi:hypothetical protein
MLIFARGQDLFGISWEPPMALFAVLIVLSLPIFFPALMPQIDGGPADEMAALRQLILLMAWMAINSYLVGYLLAWRYNVTRRKRAQREKQNGNREPTSGGD